LKNLCIDPAFYLSKFSSIHAFFDCSDKKTKTIDFSETIFPEGDIDFSQSIFANGRVEFSTSKFINCNLLFLSTKFIKADVGFDCIDFENCKLDFYDSEIYSKVGFALCHFSKYCNFQFKKCNNLDLRRTTNKDAINLTNNLKNHQQNIQTIDLRDFINLGIIQIDWKKSNVKQLIENQGNKTTHQEKAEQLRILKENFRKIGQYDDEDKAYVEFKFHELRSELDENGKKNKGIKKLYDFIKIHCKILIFEKIGLYGTSPIKVIKTMGWSLLIFSIIYLLPCLKFNQTKKFTDLTFVNKILTSIYHSVITFLTIGYGDINPANFCTVIVSGIEGFIGLFLMAYFVVAFSRKVLR